MTLFTQRQQGSTDDARPRWPGHQRSALVDFHEDHFGRDGREETNDPIRSAHLEIGNRTALNTSASSISQRAMTKGSRRRTRR